MKSIASLLVCLAIVAGCRGSSSGTSAGSSSGSSAAGSAAASSVPEAYRSDIDNLCDAVARSGADQRPAAEHPLLIARWLGDHIHTDEARQYLAQIQPLTGEAKATALEAEARRVGLPRCALADQWRSPPAVP